MDTVKTLTTLTQIIDDLLVSGDYPGLEELSGTRRDRNGDLLVDFLQTGTKDAPLEMVTIRIQLTTVQSR
jgi:hypothetical protein